MATNLQQPIIYPPVFAEDGHHPVIQLTMGWLLGTIHCWDGREHTPSLGYGHYPSTHKVISLFVVLLSMGGPLTWARRGSEFPGSLEGVVLQEERLQLASLQHHFWIERMKLLDDKGKIGEDLGKCSGLEGKLEIVGKDEEQLGAIWQLRGSARVAGEETRRWGEAK